ncbi:helix-turn-helix domain-containing protein [Niallia circulans]|uniref:helix-turn-helix domain-containing protein n=1 Tax=Niallia circulans TaxID=1397 RepID=UPI002040B40A|nr:helix-turn-helix domain-containing protein [Niallia circulans]MCM2982303.1 helix-turn-helix domain-containing protein [Niallia circulans]
MESNTKLKKSNINLGKYEEENKEYQALLDNRYNGTVQPIERFINFNASILHYCSDCKKEWYSKPLWLLTRANQEHICGVNTAKVNPKEIRKNLTTDEKLQISKMAEQGVSKTKIANHFGISRATVISHLRKAGLM